MGGKCLLNQWSPTPGPWTGGSNATSFLVTKFDELVTKFDELVTTLEGSMIVSPKYESKIYLLAANLFLKAINLIQRLKKKSIFLNIDPNVKYSLEFLQDLKICLAEYEKLCTEFAKPIEQQINNKFSDEKKSQYHEKYFEKCLVRLVLKMSLAVENPTMGIQV
ncbi:hypothetical protein TNCV_2283381 [Trichonephila clavipes]|nr:hypothetical protein TNCV_2283381 [Trichonephila clavipes]